MSLHLFNHLPTLTAFCCPIQTIHSFINTHLLLDQGSLHRFRQLSAKFYLTTVASHLFLRLKSVSQSFQILISWCKQWLVSRKCSNHPPFMQYQPYSSISRPTPSSNRQLQSYPSAYSQIPSSQQGPFPFTLMDNQGSSHSAESAHYSHPPSAEGILLSATAALSVPARPKPAPGLFMFGRLTFLDKKVSRCYGCGEALKPKGLIPHPPDDLVVTTRLHRKVQP